MEGAANDPGNVGIDRRFPPFEGETGDGARCIPSHPGQLTELDRIVGKAPITVGHHLACQGVQVMRTAVVAQPVPGLAHGGWRGIGQVMDGGEAAQEGRVEPFHPAYLGLLQHELGDGHPIGIASAAPGQVTPVAAKPAQ